MAEASDTASDTFTLGETRVLVDCAYFAGSGLVKEAADEILSQLQGVVHQDAAALLAWDPFAGCKALRKASRFGATLWLTVNRTTIAISCPAF